MFAYCRNNPVIRKDPTGTDDICYTTQENDENPMNDLATIGGRGGGGGCGGGGTLASFRSTLQSALNGLNMAMGQRNMSHTEKHHIFTNKNKKYEPQFKELTDRYNYSLDKQENIVLLPGHSGRHTNAYHETMLFYLNELDKIAKGASDVFMEGIGMIAEFLLEHPELPYAKYK